MTKTRHLLVGLTVALASWLTAGAAYALNDHSWVSSTGSGSTCTQAAPCARFDTAQAATNPTGIISVIGPLDDQGSINITKSLTIRAVGVDGGSTSVTNDPGNPFWIQVSAAANDVVILEGLHLNGGGVQFDSGGRLHVVGCVISNVPASGNTGILFQPNSASKLSVTDSVIVNNGSGTGGGIVVRPRSGGSAQVNLERVTVNGNAFGIVADGSSSTAGINMTIADSMVGGNVQDGIIATSSSGHAPLGVMVTNTKSVNNAFGTRSIGPNVTVRVKNSDIIGNVTGLSFSGGGLLQTYGNNSVDANAVNGTFSGPIPLK